MLHFLALRQGVFRVLIGASLVLGDCVLVISDRFQLLEVGDELLLVIL